MCYHSFLIKQGFEKFLRIPPYSMRCMIPETLVQRFHTETATFHLSCGEYVVLPLDWTAILRLRFSGHSLSPYSGDEIVVWTYRQALDQHGVAKGEHTLGAEARRHCTQAVLLLLHWKLPVWQQLVSANLQAVVGHESSIRYRGV